MATLSDTLTFNELARSSLRLIRVLESGEPGTAAEITDARLACNQMLDSWNTDSNRIVALFNEDQTIASGTTQYTIGSGGTWDTDRPIRLESVFVTTSLGYTYPVAIVSNEHYQGIVDKTVTSSWPDRVRYTPNYPLGVLDFWPISNQTLTCNLSSWKQLAGFSSNSATVTVPPGYQRAIRHNLAIELAPEYGAKVSSAVAKIAEESLASLETTNKRDYPVSVDNALIGSNRIYNIYSDSAKQ